MEIRAARSGDEHGIAKVHVESWETTYRGLFPDEILDNQSLDQRIRLWHEIFRRGDSFTYVAVDEGADIVGFVSGGPNRDIEAFPEFMGELYAIYILKAFQRSGTGRKLTEALMREFLLQNVTSMMLWVAKGNEAEAFYKSTGGTKLTEEIKEFRGHPIVHIAYGWPDIRTILGIKR